MEDDRVSLLEQQLAQAKLIAEEADKKYEEVGHEPANEKKISILSRRTCGSHFDTHLDEPTIKLHILGSTHSTDNLNNLNNVFSHFATSNATSRLLSYRLC